MDTATGNSEMKVDPDVEEDLRGLLKMADSTGSGRSLCSAEHVQDASSFWVKSQKLILLCLN